MPFLSLKGKTHVFQTYVLVKNNLWGKLLSSLESPTTFDESFKVASVSFLTPDVNLSCKLDNFTIILSHFMQMLY